VLTRAKTYSVRVTQVLPSNIGTISFVQAPCANTTDLLVGGSCTTQDVGGAPIASSDFYNDGVPGSPATFGCSFKSLVTQPIRTFTATARCLAP
jgi:hypothetical protein